MSEAAILLKRFTFTHGEKTWELGRPNLGTEAAYGRHMLKEEARFLAGERESLGPQGYQDALRLHMANGTNNWFGWLRPGFLESLESPSNAAKFLWLWFTQKSTTGPAEDFVAEEAMQLLYRDSVAWKILNALISEAVRDPNPLPPE